MSNPTATRSSSNGLGLGAVLFLIFLVLKLVGVIDWSWWWVTAPIWLPAAFLVGFLAVGALGLAVSALVKK